MRTSTVLLTLLSLTVYGGLDESWLKWTSAQAQEIGKVARVQGRVGGFFDTRIMSTNTSYNYKLAATWFHADVLRAAVRITQLSERLRDGEARKLVATAEAIDAMIVMVEIDPREGSGVVPADWLAVLQPLIARNQAGPPVRGRLNQSLRDVKGLSGTVKRNYDYDRFWLEFPRHYDDGTPVLRADATQLELVVRIASKEGRVRWAIPASASRVATEY
jgi:hypothetical protein